MLVWSGTRSLDLPHSRLALLPTNLIARSTILPHIKPNYELLNVFCRKNIAKLNKELQTKTLLQLSETDRLRHTEHQLHISESKVEKLNSENIKLRLKIDDLRIKMQNCKYYSDYTVLVYCALNDQKKNMTAIGQGNGQGTNSSRLGRRKVGNLF